MCSSDLAVYYKDPHVTTTMNGRVLFLGDAGATGVVPIYNERLSIIDAIAQVGTIDPTAKRDKVWLIREKEGEREYVQLDLNDRSIFNSPYFYLKNNDVIYAQPNRIRSFITVNNPVLSLVNIGTGLLGILFGVIALTR